MISEVIDSLRTKMPSAFNPQPEGLPDYPIEKSYHETIPFRKESRLQSVYPADTFRIDRYNAPTLEADTELEEETRAIGAEAYSWYKPFHFNETKWGVYVRWRGVVHMAYSLFHSEYEPELSGILKASLIKDAFRILHSHSYFHFLVEWAASFMESLFGIPFYYPYLASICKEEERMEESLANAYSLRQVDIRVRGPLAKKFQLQPSSYREFEHYVNEEDFARGKRRLGACIYSSHVLDTENRETSSGVSEAHAWEVMFNAEPRRLCVWEVPIYLVAEPRPAKSFPQMVQILVSDYSDRVDAVRRSLSEAFKSRKDTVDRRD